MSESPSRGDRPPLIARLLDRETRRRLFEPAFHDLLADHLERSSAPPHWLRRAFFRIRVVGLVVQCAWLRAPRPRLPRR